MLVCSWRLEVKAAFDARHTGQSDPRRSRSSRQAGVQGKTGHRPGSERSVARAQWPPCAPLQRVAALAPPAWRPPQPGFGAPRTTCVPPPTPRRERSAPRVQTFAEGMAKASTGSGLRLIVPEAQECHPQLVVRTSKLRGRAPSPVYLRPSNG
eukprot:6519329-Prymnesium_polylepis.1